MLLYDQRKKNLIHNHNSYNLTILNVFLQAQTVVNTQYTYKCITKFSELYFVGITFSNKFFG